MHFTLVVLDSIALKVKFKLEYISMDVAFLFEISKCQRPMKINDTRAKSVKLWMLYTMLATKTQYPEIFDKNQ